MTTDFVRLKGETIIKNLSDQELMSLYLKGDQLAFEEIYKRYKDRVYSYLKKRLTNQTQIFNGR